MQTIFLIPIDLLSIFFASINLLIILIIDLFITTIEGAILKKMGYGTRLKCLGMAFLMNSISTFGGYILFVLSTIKDWRTVLAYFPGAFIADLINPYYRDGDIKVLVALSLWLCVATVLELLILLVFRGEHSSSRLVKMGLAANFFSSLILFGLIGLAKLSVSE